MKKLTLLIIAIFCLVVSGYSEAETTRKDFDEFCANHIGLWTGEVASIIGESRVGKKGESET